MKNIIVTTPFSFCEYCHSCSIEEEVLISNDKKNYTYKCQYSDICEANENARHQEDIYKIKRGY